MTADTFPSVSVSDYQKTPDLCREGTKLLVLHLLNNKGVAFDLSECAGEIVTEKKKKWVQDVKTISTYPPGKLFTKDAETIARTMASKKVSPKGIGLGIRMIQFFINRAGKNLPAGRKRELERAKQILQAKLANKK